MAHAQELIPWILNHADGLNLRVENLTWIRNISTHLTDVAAHITIDGVHFSGYGTAADKDLALAKAFAEAAERAVVRIHKFPTSNGVAAHTDQAAAQRAAEEELKERDQILCHFFTRHPFRRLNVTARDFPQLDLLTSWYLAHGYNYKIFQLGQHGVLFVADGREAHLPFGFVLGAGRKTSLRESLLSATIEANRQVALIAAQNKILRPMALQEFARLTSPQFPHHGQLALDLDYAEQIAGLFASSHAESKAESTAAIEIDEIECRIPALAGCPLFFARARSAHLQDIYLGIPSPQKVNFNRLALFAGVKLDFADLCHLPHPFN